MKKLSFYGFCRKALFVIAAAVLILLFLLNFIYNARVSYNGAEKVSFQLYIVPGLIMLLFIVALPLLAIEGKNFLKLIDSKKLFWILSAIYVVMAIYLLANSDLNIRADAATVFNTAKSFAKGDYSALKNSGYMGRYPHQTGLLLYDSILQIFCPFPVISFVVNLFFVIGINYFTVKTADVLFKSHGVTLLTTVLAFAFLPQFFFIMFAYGLTPGFFFMTLGFYNAVRFGNEGKIKNGVGAVLGAGFAAFFKQNFLIGAIAMAIYFVLKLFASKKDLIKKGCVLLCLIAFLFVPSSLVKSYYEAKSGIELDQGCPAVLWVAMGTDLDNNERAPGWYTGYNFRVYTDSGYNSEKASEIGMEKLKENLEEMKNNPRRAFRFFLDKTKSQWCEPMFQSVWSGPLEDCGQYTHTALLQSIYNGGLAERFIATVSKLAVLVIFAFTLAFLFIDSKGTDGWEIALMFIIGGLLFHTVWEGKSQYTYPYVFTLIPFAAQGVGSAAKKLKKLFGRIDNGKK